MVGHRKPGSGCCSDVDQCCCVAVNSSSKCCGGTSGNSDAGGSTNALPLQQAASSREEDSRQASTSGGSASSNLAQFLHHTTPKVQRQYLPKTCLWDNCVKRWRPSSVESIPFFNLGDLWNSFDEESAYGAGVPLVLNGKEAVIQYYVPYLSALQLYTRTGVRRCLNFRKPSNDTDSDYRDSNSEASSDNDSLSSVEGISPIKTSFWKKCQNEFCRARTGAAPLSSLHEDSSDDEEQAWQMKEANHLLLSYLEDSAPYSRVPLVDKIAELEKQVPEIRTLNSFELLPTSWLSIAWYPIYRIPTGPTLKDLGTCFLTFHSLSTPLQGSSFTSRGVFVYDRAVGSVSDVPDLILGSARLDLVEGSVRLEQRSNKLALEPFGLASYKLRGAFSGAAEKQTASGMETSATSWLQALRVRHPDFEFFASRSPARR